jgi:hypothetical protein
MTKPYHGIHSTPVKSRLSPIAKPHFEGHAVPFKTEPQLVPIMNLERKLPMVQEHGALSSILTSPK